MRLTENKNQFLLPADKDDLFLPSLGVQDERKYKMYKTEDIHTSMYVCIAIGNIVVNNNNHHIELCRCTLEQKINEACFRVIILTHR